MSFTASGIVTLLSDFGTADGYVAAMKGAILAVSPGLRVVDVTHEVPPQDVRSGAFILAQVAPVFPPGTVHVAVVDPGVGSLRRPLLVLAAGQAFVGPDNGLLTRAAPRPHEVRHLSRPSWWRPAPSRTFHGRDLFAPVAAHLASGRDPADAGPVITDPVELCLPEPVERPGGLVGEVIHADRFGNLVTNVGGDRLAGADPAALQFAIAGFTITGLSATFADVAPGELVAYVGSDGLLEVGRRGGDARHYLGAPLGTAIQVIRDAR
jgi:hypothetical protein